MVRQIGHEIRWSLKTYDEQDALRTDSLVNHLASPSCEIGVRSDESGDCEVDHLIPLELGGSNSIKKSLAEIPPNLPLERPS
jgi:hypothetical protein